MICHVTSCTTGTGTGKTLSFVLPLLEVLRNDEGSKKNVRGRPPRVLVLAPTRELANQVGVGVVSCSDLSTPVR